MPDGSAFPAVFPLLILLAGIVGRLRQPRWRGTPCQMEMGDGGSSEERMHPVLIYSLFYPQIDFNTYFQWRPLTNHGHYPEGWHGRREGHGQLAHAEGQGERNWATTCATRTATPHAAYSPPRPKLMPTSVRHGGAWMQCFLWVPFQPGASPAMPPPVSPCGPPPPPPPQTSAPTTPAPTAAAEAGVPEGTGPAAREEIVLSHWPSGIANGGRG